MTEDTLTQRLRKGDADAFDELYARHASMIYRLGWSILRDKQGAEDAVQETFLRAYKARQRYDPGRASFSTWLYQIALNYCRSQLRRKRLLTVPWFSQASDHANQPTSIPSPEANLLQNEYQNALWEAVRSLSPRLREVITLHYYLDLPATEIAALLNCPEGTIYSRLHNARRRLTKTLAQRGITAAEGIEVQNAP